MSDDPREEQRLRVHTAQRSDLPPTQVLERIRQKLSPCDDDLPFAQAVRAKDEMAKAAAAFRKREKARDTHE